MGNAIKHGFANLTNFSGRDSRSLFWWWVLLIVVVTFALSFISGIVFTAGAMGTAFQAGSAGVDQQQMQADMMQSATRRATGVALSQVSESQQSGVSGNSGGSGNSGEYIKDMGELRTFVVFLMQMYPHGFNLSTLKAKIKTSFRKILCETVFGEIKLFAYLTYLV